jgi:23S rRNA (cytosine1962-C5)-methyltransferase
MDTPLLRLKPKHDRRVKSGHPWVFSNELSTDLQGFEPGMMVDVADAKGAFVGRGYVNPHSLIAVRILTRRRLDIDDPVYWIGAIRSAVAHRKALYPDRTSMRLVNAEGDLLPGLVVDRYGDQLAVQLNTAGTETRKDAIATALQTVCEPAGAVLRSEGKARDLEGLEQERAVWFGEVPDTNIIDEFGVQYELQPLGGQKTGHYLDQAVNRAFAGSLSAGRSVLDVYAHSGGFSLHALKGGAERAVAVDKSADACALAEHNATLNGVADRMDVVKSEGKTFLKESLARSDRYGIVVLDPPAFAKSRKTAGRALRGYQDLNALAMSLVEPGGYLFTSSCSYHVLEERFVEAIHKAAVQAGRRLRLVRRGEQGADHAIRLEIAETRYLKHYVFQVELDG